MNTGNKAIVITKSEAEGERLANDIRSIMDDIRIIGDYENAYTRIRETRPDAVFHFLTEDTRRDMDLIRRITRHLPEIKVFVVAEEKDPELILEGLRARVSDFLLFPSDNGALKKSVQNVMGQSEGKSGEVIAVFSLKGGQGNSTISINLADHIQELTGDKVLLADLNLTSGDIGPGLDISESYTGFDMIRDKDRMDKNLFFSSLHHYSGKFYVLPTPGEITDADQVKAEDINRMLNIMKQCMDYTILDIPHDLSERSLAALDAADKILLIARQSLPVIKSVQRTLDLFQDLNYSQEKVQVILSGYSDKGEFNKKDIGNVFKQPVFASITDDPYAVTQCENRAKTLGMIRENSRINKDFRMLASRLTGIGTDDRARKGWKGLLGKLKI
jgi:pilus assembly protein CpaE